jgi:mannosyltransferase OCH1-like enzyme
MIYNSIFIPTKFEKITDNEDWVKARRLNKKNGFQIKIWKKKDILELIERYYPEFLFFINEFENDWYLIDFSRLLILHHCGGIYIDLDIILKTKEIPEGNLIGYWINKKGDKEMNNDFFRWEKDHYYNCAIFLRDRYYSNKMPKCWKIRKFLFSVGNKGYTAFIKNSKAKFTIFDNYDRSNSSSWLSL